MMDAAYEYESSRKKYYPISCHRLSKAIYRFYSDYNSSRVVENVSELILAIRYPENVRIITQTKDVDIHALIGNIGGYVGLFLGNVR